MAVISTGEAYVTLAEVMRTASAETLTIEPGSAEDAILMVVATAVSLCSQGQQIARDDVNANTATGDRLTAIGRASGVIRRAATSSRYTTRAVDGPATLVGGELVRGGGPTGRTEWRVITTGVVNAGDPVVVEAVETGATQLSGTVVLDLVTTTPGLTELTWVAGTDPAGQIGRARESDADLRVRIDDADVGLRLALRNLDWITVAIVETTGAGTLSVTVAPAPVGADQIAELVNTIGVATLGLVTSGANSGTYTAVDETTTTIRWDVGTTEAVDVAITVVGSTSGVADAIRTVFGSLGIGDVVVRQRVIAAAMSVAGVTDVTACTLDGAATNYTPSLGNVAIPGTITVTT